eukprot:4358018-Amphidinium_carterae.1
MASSSATSGVPTTPRPKPSQAPIDPDVELLPAAAEEVTSPVSPQYSAADSDTPDIRQFTVSEAFDLLKQPTQMSPTHLAAFWAADPMKESLEFMAPNWQKLIQRHSCVHFLSVHPTDGATNDSLTLWIHSSLSTLDRMIKEKSDLGMRYIFTSPAQAGLHHVAHSHFQLSSATLKSDTVLVAIEVDELYIIEHGSSCENGYLKSVSMPCLPLDQAHIKLVGMIHVASSLQKWLNSPPGLALTRASISQFESFSECEQMSSHQLVTRETAAALMMHTPGSAKVHATLKNQSVELYQSWVEMIKEAKAEWIKQYEEEKSKNSEAAAVSNSSQSQCPKNTVAFQVAVEDGDEVTISVKKQKLTAAANTAAANSV